MEIRIAKDNNKHWVLSISFGGNAHGTKYLFIDKEKGSININGFRFIGANRNDLSLNATIKQNKLPRSRADEVLEQY